MNKKINAQAKTLSENRETTLDFNLKLHRIGRIWNAVGILLILSIPLIAGIFFNAQPEWSVFANAGVITLLIINFFSGVFEPIIYAPMLGISGEYLAFITGNLSNLKIPCVVKSQEIVGSKMGTEENELISTISIAVSSLTTALIIAVMVLFLAVSPLQEAIEANPFLNNAFGCVVYALFGALGGKYIVRNVKLAIGPGLILVVVSIALALLGSSLGSLSLMIGIVLCAVWAFAPIIRDALRAKKEKAIYSNISNGVDLDATYAKIYAQNAKADAKAAKKSNNKK